MKQESDLSITSMITEFFNLSFSKVADTYLQALLLDKYLPLFTSTLMNKC